MINQILNEIKEAKKIICLRHRDPDGDAVGSAFGLAYFIRENFPDKQVLVDGTSDLEYLSFLGRKDEVSDDDYVDALVIVCDTANRERIDGKLAGKTCKVIKIDHHPNHEDYGDLSWVDDRRIAASEMIGELMLVSQWKIPLRSWECVYTGLITDSNRFMYHGTSALSFRVAQAALDAHVDINAIYDRLYIQSLDSYRLKAYIMHKLKITANGVGYVVLKEREARRFRKSIDIARSFVNVLGGIQEVKIWMIATQSKKDHNVRLSIRSRHHIINAVAQKYNGGGHELAAGARIADFKKLKSVIADLEETVITSNLMIQGKGL